MQRGGLASLAGAHGWSFLFALSCYQHVMKGFVGTYVYTSFDFVLRDYHVRGPRMQLLKVVAMLPWALKPLLGVASDIFPILGYRKTPYLVAAALFGTCSFLRVGWPGADLELGAVVLAFFGMSIQIVTCDLLAEAATAERIRKFPESGPSLISFVAAGVTVGEIVATATIGYVLDVFGPRGPSLICALPSVLMLIPALTNSLGEISESQETTKLRRSSFLAQGELFVLVGATAAVSLLLALTSLSSLEEKAKFVLMSAATGLMVLAFLALLNPVVGLMIVFFFSQSVSTISLEGGTFYFFTDDEVNFPIGPHFSVWFYTTGLGLAASFCGLLSLAFYHRYMAGWRYRQLFILSNSLWCLVSAVNVLVYTRRNLHFGIPDQTFVLGGAVLQTVFERWTSVPGCILLSQVCPKGMEATMFALLAGCLNLGRSVAAFFGAFMLEELGITPDGTSPDRTKFAYLWEAAVCQALAPLVTLWLVPKMLPDRKQTDKIFEDGDHSATSGSPWSRARVSYIEWFGTPREPCASTSYGATARSDDRAEEAA